MCLIDCLDEEVDLEGVWQAFLYRCHRGPFCDESPRGLCECEGEGDTQARGRSPAPIWSAARSDSYTQAKLGPRPPRYGLGFGIDTSMTEVSCCATTGTQDPSSTSLSGSRHIGVFVAGLEVFVAAAQDWQCSRDGGRAWPWIDGVSTWPFV